MEFSSVRNIASNAKKTAYVLTAVVGMALASTSAYAGSKPFPTSGQYTNGVKLPSHVSRSAMASVVRTHYNAWKRAYVRTTGGQGAWIKFDNTNSGVSEGQGYGMVIAAYMDDQTLFDQLNNFAIAHPSQTSPHLMSWKQTLRSGRMVDVEGQDGATDGDMDIAYGLLLADKQWGSTSSKNYRQRAINVMRAILQYQVNASYNSLMLGEWASGNDRNLTRPSDFMTGHLISFAAADSTNASRWNAILGTINSTINNLGNASNNPTGLLADFLVRSGNRFVAVSGNVLEDANDKNYWYNSSRTPWRFAMSYISHGRTDLLTSQRKALNFLRNSAGSTPSNIKTGFQLPSGTPIEDYSDLTFVAPMAVNAMLGTSSAEQQWLNDLWDSITGEDFGVTEGYFGDTIRMQALITLSGNWWKP